MGNHSSLTVTDISCKRFHYQFELLQVVRRDNSRLCKSMRKAGKVDGAFFACQDVGHDVCGDRNFEIVLSRYCNRPYFTNSRLQNQHHQSSLSVLVYYLRSNNSITEPLLHEGQQAGSNVMRLCKTTCCSKLHGVLSQIDELKLRVPCVNARPGEPILETKDVSRPSAAIGLSRMSLITCLMA